MPSVSNSLKTVSSYSQQSNKTTVQSKSTSQNKTASSVIKGTSVAVQQNPLKGTNYSVNTTQRGTTVLTIVDNSAGRTKNGVPVGAPAVRIDSPHNGANYNHINTNPSLYPNNAVVKALDHKPVSNTFYNAAKNFDDVAKVAKVGGRALAVAAVVMDGKDIYDSY